jgi:putative Mg2+ transporter-C (MgtC) family protein
MPPLVFGQLETEFLIALVLCLIAGFLIGAERETRHKAAGISTHILVIAGAMLFTFISSVIVSNSSATIAAQVVTGIGFLGAGLILKDGMNVHNLTTAASLWFAAAIGMAFGFGLYTIGIIATVAGIFVPRIPSLQKDKKEILH